MSVAANSGSAVGRLRALAHPIRPSSSPERPCTRYAASARIPVPLLDTAIMRASHRAPRAPPPASPFPARSREPPDDGEQPANDRLQLGVDVASEAGSTRMESRAGRIGATRIG